MEYTLLIAIGIMIGIFSGLLGIGGAIILIPILVYGFGYTQVWQYYKSGLIQNQNIKVGLIVAVGMFAGTFIGARILPLIPADVLKKAFAIFLVLVAIKMWRS
jgi:hypothetical protein